MNFIVSLRILPKEIPFGSSGKISSMIVIKEVVHHTERERERERGRERERAREIERSRGRERGCLMSVSREGREEGDDSKIS